eukprot:TRINITY_DN3489_c0_g1_i1.p1 TRINITY_DN3489_c0_g1~~TRINITY_DN3489_c0_g1_i1.p1  ORF type:complete len:1017 (+),score=289.90 TRINITY_DN3489_c0_g1_i1:80-3130(+)
MSSKLIENLPDFIKNNLNFYSLIVVFRCALAAWIGLILLIDDNTLRAIGNATFFILIAVVMQPPSDSTINFIFGGIIMMTGALFGWAWGCIAMRAALASRDQVRTNQEIRNVAIDARTNGQTNIDAAIQLAVFRGDFLEAGPSIIFIAFLAVLVYFMAILKTVLPKFTFFAIFAMIVGDVMMTYGPLFPAAQYTLGQIFIIPMAIYFAISLSCSLLIYPMSSNRKVTGFMSKLMFLLSSLHSDSIQVLKTSCTTPEFEKLERLNETKKKMTLVWTGLSNSLTLLEAEMSIGRLNASDLKAISQSLRDLLFMSYGLMSYYDSMVDSLDKEKSRGNKEKKGEEEEMKEKRKSRKEKKQNTKETMGCHETLRIIMVEKRWKPDNLSEAIDSLSSCILSTLEEVLTASTESLLLLGKIFDNLEKQRIWSWISGEKADPQESEQLKTAMEKLRSSIERFETEKRFILTEYVPELFDEDGKVNTGSRENQTRIRGISLGLKTQFNAINNVKYLLKFMEQMEVILKDRQRARPWVSTSLRALSRWLRRQEKMKGIEAIDQTTKEEASMESNFYSSEKRNPDYIKENTFSKKIGRGIVSLFRFITSTPSIVGIRTAIVTILLALPQVYAPSAYFMYVNKSLWALIMAQFGVTAFVGDHFFNWTFRVLGTFAGGVIGMVLWYIGNGNGSGSPYGIATVMAFAFFLLMFVRIYGPPPATLFIIMTSVTTALIIGYSWVNTHLVQVGNQGVGWEIAWRRFLLVLIGMTAASIIMLFPKPSTGRRELRFAFARTLKELGELYSYLIGTWMGKKTLPSKQFYSKIFEIVGVIAQADTRIAFSKFEPSIEGRWPVERYQKIQKLQFAVVRNLIHIAQGLKKMDPLWKESLLKRTSILEPHLIGDTCATWFMLSSSLHSGNPLPQITPGPLTERIYYHSLHSEPQVKENSTITTDGEEKGEKNVEGPPSADEPLRKEHLQHLQFIPFANCVVSHLQLLRRLDELVHEVKELVGETFYVEGYQSLWNLKEEV